MEASDVCNCTLLRKTHDFTLDQSLAKMQAEDRTRALEKFERKGILLIRNPFKAIMSYRNFQYGGMKGLAPSRAFKGKGMI